MKYCSICKIKYNDLQTTYDGDHDAPCPQCGGPMTHGDSLNCEVIPLPPFQTYRPRDPVLAILLDIKILLLAQIGPSILTTLETTEKRVMEDYFRGRGL